MDLFSDSDFTDSSLDVNDSSCAVKKDGASTAGKFVPVSHVDVGSKTISYEKPSFISQDSQLEPAVGMVFHSEEQAYNFYNSYARRKGFSIRKGHISRRTDGSIRSRGLLCSREGTHQSHEARKPRSTERTKCMARIEYKVDNNGVWVVSKVNLEHNHSLTSPNLAHLLRSQRKGLHARHGVTDVIGNHRGTSQAINMDARGTCNIENFRFPWKYKSSSLHAMRTRDLQKGDAQILLDFLKAKASEDPSFFYDIQLDEMDRMTNFFWVDLRSIIDYYYFGDVVSLDTTYRVNKCDLPLALFTGVNHHKQNLVFGAALLLDETEESIVWLLKTFLFAMSGRQPYTILTDHCIALSQAISVVLPNTHHRLCLWHIYQNSLKHLSSIYNNQTKFKKELKNCLYEGGSEENFHAGWNSLMYKYDIAGNSWLQDLLANRERWALVYNRNLFCASMMTMQWSESMSVLFKEYISRRASLSELLQQYEEVLCQLREKELSEDFKSQHTQPVLLVDIPMLNEAAEPYTRVIYTDFENEFKNQINCLCEPIALDEKLYTFRVSRPGDRCYWIVEFDPSNITVTCSCQRFESMGILCMHVLKVLNNNNILHLPCQYILKRWTKFANKGVFDAESQESLVLKYSRIFHKAISFAHKSVASNHSLEYLEHGLDLLISDVGNTSISNTTQAVEQGGQNDSVEGSHERQRKRKSRTSCNSVEIGI